MRRPNPKLEIFADQDVAKTSGADDWSEAFDLDFWPAYPRKVCKFASRKAWNRIRPHTQAHLDEIWRGLERWLAYWSDRGTESDFIPHASTWINQHRWEDEP